MAKKTIEDTAPSMPAAPAPLRQAEEWAEAKKTPAWLFAATKAHENWPQGREVTESAFDAAVARTSGITIGG